MSETTAQIAGYSIHPAAQLFPMMEDAELADLAESIKRGYDPRHPVVLLGNQILDGRNRAEACARIGVTPQTRPATDQEGADAIEFVMRENFRRRHLTPSQRAAIAADAQLLLEERRARERMAQGGGDRRSEGARRNREAPPGAPRSAPPSSKGKAAEKVAAIAAVGTRTVERAKATKKKSPELFEKVKKGDLTLKQAEKQIRHAEQLERVRSYVTPDGEFPVIVADPAWPYEDQLQGEGARGATPYPQATLEEIKAQVPPMAKDCVVFLWCTNQHLIDLDAPVHQVLRAWGLQPKALLTWKKDRMGLGRYVRNITEQCVLATRGKPLLTLTVQTTFIEAPRSAHSAKPEQFFAMVEELCPERPLLELNARQPRKGWVTSGAELAGAVRSHIP